MTTIRATCPHCGEVDLAPTDIQLTVVRAEGMPVGPDSRYTFDCPGCTESVAKPADERIARLLTTGGVEVSVIQDSEPVPPHPEDPPGGPAFTPDDLIDFHFQLQQREWFRELVAAGS